MLLPVMSDLSSGGWSLTLNLRLSFGRSLLCGWVLKMLCLEEGQALGVPFPSAAYTREILIAAMGLGHADDDFAAMIEPLQNAGGTEL